MEDQRKAFNLFITDWRRTARSIVLQKFFFIIIIIFFLKFIFEHKKVFFQIRIQNSWGAHALSFSKFMLVSEQKNNGEFFKFSVKANK